MSKKMDEITKRLMGLDIALLKSTFSVLQPKGLELVERFYKELFRKYPEVEDLFNDIDHKDQQKKLLSALSLVVNTINSADFPVEALQSMGRRHQLYGAEPEHFEAVRETLLEVIRESAGDLWNNNVAKTWRKALDLVADIMLSGYHNEESYTMATTKKGPEKNSNAAGGGEVTEDLFALMDVLEYAPINIMIADADEKIVFVNKRAREVLGSVEEELASYLPGFRVDEVVGGSIHRYHKNPDAVKMILNGIKPGDARKGEITPGRFIFAHETRRLMDKDGNHLGFVVQWNDVTEERQREEQAQRLQKAVDGAQTAMMMIDRDLKITYANSSTTELLRKYEETLRSLYPSFSVDGIIGTCIDIFHKNPSHQRRILENPANLPYETDIHVGPLTFRILVSAIRDLAGEYVGNTLEWSDVTELRAGEMEVARLQSAINGSTTALMLCNPDLTITYVNPAVVTLLRNRQEQLRKVFPGFDAGNLVGQSIDQFHKNPAHQRSLLADMSRLPVKADIKLLDLEFEVNATAIVDRQGNMMGNLVEWKDITEQKDGERQIQGLIKGAIAGELSQRIETSHYEGFMKNVGDGVNALMNAVVNPIEETTRVVQAMAEGDLTQKMSGEFEGQFAVLCDAVNTTFDNMENMVSKILQSCNSITSSAAEIAQGNSDLSQRTEQQASSLEETASSMEELTGTVKQNADNAKQANQLAVGARSQAEKGGDVVGNAVQAMSEINSSSKKIADIIGVIDEIAFQTNLLALNAAVEAARAGEQGRGFAVVAAEVRNLAQRSAAAAKEIKSLIKDSVEKVEDGTRLVDESGQTLGEIVTAVKKVSDIIAEIAAASQEQSSGIEQVNKAIAQMDQVTQQNAALVEEAAAASESLDDQAQGLDQLMTFFSTSDERGGTHNAVANLGSSKAAKSNGNQTRRTQLKAEPRRTRAKTKTAEDEWEEF